MRDYSATCKTTVRACLMIFIIYLYCGYSQFTERIASFTRMTCRVRYYKSTCGIVSGILIELNGTYQHCILLPVGTKPALYSSIWLFWASHIMYRANTNERRHSYFQWSAVSLIHFVSNIQEWLYNYEYGCMWKNAPFLWKTEPHNHIIILHCCIHTCACEVVFGSCKLTRKLYPLTMWTLCKLRLSCVMNDSDKNLSLIN